MATAVSGWSAYKDVGGQVKRRIRAVVSYSVTTTETQVKATAYLYMQVEGGSYSSSYYDTGYLGATGYSTVSGKYKMVYGGTTTPTLVGTQTYTWNKTTSAQTKYISARLVAPSGVFEGTYTVPDIAISVPTLPSYTVNYNANGGTGTVEPQTKWYGINLTLQSSGFEKEGWILRNWRTTAGEEGGATYELGGTYTGNSAVTLYAVWQPVGSPTAKIDKAGLTTNTYALKYFGSYAVKFTVTQIFEWRTATAKLVVGETETEPISITNGTSYTITSDILKESGTISARLVLEDSVGAVTQIALTPIELGNPSWEKTFHITDTKKPDIGSDGNADIKLYRYNEVTSAYALATDKFTFTGVDNDWYITVPFTEVFVDFGGEDIPSKTPDVKIKIEYTHTDTSETESRKAFYQTTRNQNYSNGIYSVMFVGGVIPYKAPSYASRVWWCHINNPLYFPDTNYAEVGSNDTRVMGLCKVGDYLGVVKQSKTTDTAIYLLYPTSFDEETTFAQKQGIQGVGAIAKYSFNVLGDETLFLSPEGIMAIRPDGDESHKVVNRSFFIDGKLLAETSIEEAYSFVFDGKYWLSIGDRCYVLDGNQQSSWGNDRTNLVLECYYLENVPAKCFMKVDNELWFSSEESICRFKNETSSDAYADAYKVGGQYDEEGKEIITDNYPVKCEWSTILDDDGTLSYYKTMQKKGAVVSLLPETLSADGTKVFVKKDTDEPVEITREFSTHEGIPNELFINKKFKKYRRLQFIIRNDEAEPMGINSIVKMYTVGNYAKGR